jgi:CRISPR-associated protein Csb2
MLVMEVTFPHGRCYAARSDAPDCPEWPPHPSRLLSALTAAACIGRDEPDATAREALMWLEQQEPPVIEAPSADLTPMPTSYVPPGDLNSQAGKSEHPMFRIRKDRSFPVAYLLGEPVVRYGWAGEPPAALLATLDRLAAETSHVGTSHSMVAMRAYVGQLARVSYRPNASGNDTFRIPLAGRFEELRSLFYRKKPEVRRPLPVCEVSRAYGSMRAGGSTVDSIFDELLTLRFKGITHGVESAQLIARAVRRSVMSRMADPLPPEIHGHEDGPHLAWLPLCDVGHDRARGRIIGVGLALPKGMAPAARQALNRALAALFVHGIHLDDGRDVALEPLSPEYPSPLTLEQYTWTRASHDWTTVTPVVPDRLPRRSRVDFIERSIVDSLQRAGYPAPERLEVGHYSPLSGVAPAFKTPTRFPRFHVTVRFPARVAGPVIAGRLRYFGVGLFRPIDKEEGENELS